MGRRLTRSQAQRKSSEAHRARPKDFNHLLKKKIETKRTQLTSSCSQTNSKLAKAAHSLLHPPRFGLSFIDTQVRPSLSVLCGFFFTIVFNLLCPFFFFPSRASVGLSLKPFFAPFFHFFSFSACFTHNRLGLSLIDGALLSFSVFFLFFLLSSSSLVLCFGAPGLRLLLCFLFPSIFAVLFRYGWSGHLACGWHLQAGFSASLWVIMGSGQGLG